MKILSRYVLKEFLLPLGFIVIAFVGLYIIAQLVDDMRSFVEHKPALALVLLYYLYQAPYYAVQVLPMAILLSSLFSLGQLARHSELMAMRACGLTFDQITRPILVAALALVGLVLIFNELVLPWTNPRAHQLKSVAIEHKMDAFGGNTRARITRTASGNRVLYTQFLDAANGAMAGVTMLELGPDQQVTRRLDAPYAHWNPFGDCVLSNGWERTFDADGQVVHAAPFITLPVRFRESPRDFIQSEKDSHQLLSMPLKELLDRIRLMKETGANPREELVNLHLKLAFPFANLVLALLGVALPFVFPSGQRAILWAAIGFVITLLTGFFYIGFVAVGSSMGKNGTLPPLLAVWIANLLFGALGLWMMRRAQR